MKTFFAVVVIFMLGVIAIAIGVSAGQKTDKETVTNNSISQDVPATGLPVGSLSAGTYQIGVNAAPGQYRTNGPDEIDIIPSCYWQRSRNDSGEFDAIISNGNTEGPSSVTVNTGEFITFSGSCIWVLS